MAPGLGDKHPVSVLLGPHVLGHPSATCSIQGKSLALHRAQTSPGLSLHVTASPGSRGITQGSVGHSRTCHRLPMSLGKSSSVLSCHELPFSMEQLKPCSPVTRQQDTGILLCPYPASSQAPFAASLMLTQPCPIPPPAKGSWHVPGPCPARGAPAQPAPGDLHGFEACQEFYPGIWLPSSESAWCWFCEASQGQLFVLTLHYPFHENHLFQLQNQE